MAGPRGIEPPSTQWQCVILAARRRPRISCVAILYLAYPQDKLAGEDGFKPPTSVWSRPDLHGFDASLNRSVRHSKRWATRLLKWFSEDFTQSSHYFLPYFSGLSHSTRVPEKGTLYKLVPLEGIEPTRLSAQDPKSCVSAFHHSGIKNSVIIENRTPCLNDIHIWKSLT